MESVTVESFNFAWIVCVCVVFFLLFSRECYFVDAKVFSRKNKSFIINFVDDVNITEYSFLCVAYKAYVKDK